MLCASLPVLASTTRCGRKSRHGLPTGTAQATTHFAVPPQRGFLLFRLTFYCSSAQSTSTTGRCPAQLKLLPYRRRRGLQPPCVLSQSTSNQRRRLAADDGWAIISLLVFLGLCAHTCSSHELLRCCSFVFVFQKQPNKARRYSSTFFARAVCVVIEARP